MRILLYLSLIVFSPALFAAEAPATSSMPDNKQPATEVPELPVTDYLPNRYLTEAQSIINDIKRENNFLKGKALVRFGLMQISTTQSTDPIQLNSRNMLPYVGIEGEYNVYKNFGLVGEFLMAEHMLGGAPASSPNSSGGTLMQYHVGAIHKWYLDHTKIKNYVLGKFTYFGMTNNFNLDDSYLSNLIFIKSYQGFSAGVERSVPATPKFDLAGGLNMIYILNSTTESTMEYKENGIGFQFFGEIFYNFKWFENSLSRLGAGYSLGVFYNRFTESEQLNTSKSSHTQNYRALSLSLSTMF